MSKDIKAVIFDLGRVLVNLDLNPWKKHIFSNIAVENTESWFTQVLDDGWVVKLNTGQINGPQFHEALVQHYGLKLDFQTFKSAWCGIFSPMPGMLELATELKAKMPVGLLSDTDWMHWRYIQENFPVVHLFDKPTLSCGIGTIKPDPKNYLAAANNVCTPIENCFFTDDLAKNVFSARQAGMTAVPFENAEKLREELKKHGIL